jgi:hypothetical protein
MWSKGGCYCLMFSCIAMVGWIDCYGLFQTFYNVMWLSSQNFGSNRLLCFVFACPWKFFVLWISIYKHPKLAYGFSWLGCENITMIKSKFKDLHSSKFQHVHLFINSKKESIRIMKICLSSLKVPCPKTILHYYTYTF